MSMSVFMFNDQQYEKFVQIELKVIAIQQEIRKLPRRKAGTEPSPEIQSQLQAFNRELIELFNQTMAIEQEGNDVQTRIISMY